MRILGHKWEGGYCDYHMHQEQVRIKVAAWLRISKIGDAYIENPASLSRVVDYLREVGALQTLRKIRSRRAEKLRNGKFLCCGLGYIQEERAGGKFKPGQEVMFIAPFHPACVDRVCLHKHLVQPIESIPQGLDLPESVFEGELSNGFPYLSLSGWSEFSGRPLDFELLEEAFEKTRSVFQSRSAQQSLQRLPAKQGPEDGEKRHRPDKPGRKAALFGLGHYAKNVILPRIKRHMQVTCIHEIDPAQLGKKSRYKQELRTSAHPQEDESYDAYLIAGFHHTHAPIAAHALEQGAAAMVEKPLATTRQDLQKIISIMKQDKAGLFLAFQRRYTPFNHYLKVDLQIDDSSPVSCIAIAYEVPLPKNHWYNWPNSKSRIISNGCHWIDHFLFVNSWSRPERIEATKLRNGDCVVMMDLENRASLSLTITEHGSSRLGLRDHVRFALGHRTATITDTRFYRSESGKSTLRKSSISRMAPYDKMYNEIGSRMAQGLHGDSLRSVEVSAKAVLDADEQVT